MSLLLSAIVTLALLGVLNWAERRRIHKLTVDRGGETFEKFSAWFKDRNVPIAVQRSVYDYLWRASIPPGTPALPGDSLVDIYGLAGQELWKAVIDLAARSHRDSSCAATSELGHLNTVADLATFIAQLPPLGDGAH
jgi:hypothetical protein